MIGVASTTVTGLAEAKPRLHAERYRVPQVRPGGDHVGDELGPSIHATRGGGDRLQQRRLAEAILPHEHGPHARPVIRADERHVDVAEELDVAHVEVTEVHARRVLRLREGAVRRALWVEAGAQDLVKGAHVLGA